MVLANLHTANAITSRIVRFGIKLTLVSRSMVSKASSVLGRRIVSTATGVRRPSGHVNSPLKYDTLNRHIQKSGLKDGQVSRKAFAP